MNRIEWVILVTAIAVSILGAAWTTDTGVRLLIMAGVVGLAVAVARMFAIQRLKAWRSVDESAFRSEYAQKFKGDPASAIAERNKLAKTLRLPPDKLAPDQLLTTLSQAAGSLAGSSVVALDDLLDEVRERTGSNAPPLEQLSVGRYIEALMACADSHRSNGE